MDCIWTIEKNVYGAWVIYGDIGYRRYMGYTKAVAKALYAQECKNAKGV